MSPRTGRPKSDNPKSNDIKVRLDDITHESLLKYCEEHQISKAEAVRRGIHLVLQQK
ncbi:MAG: CopG family transcriptional regulator [Clostridiales bacterium]|nr:CopG family transcriptional regulator [Clostridiales bacterium]